MGVRSALWARGEDPCLGPVLVVSPPWSQRVWAIPVAGLERNQLSPQKNHSSHLDLRPIHEQTSPRP